MFGNKKKIEELEAKIDALQGGCIEILGHVNFVMEQVRGINIRNRSQDIANQHVSALTADLEMWVTRHEGIEIDKH